jgi:hypothetical protein
VGIGSSLLARKIMEASPAPLLMLQREDKLLLLQFLKVLPSVGTDTQVFVHMPSCYSRLLSSASREVHGAEVAMRPIEEPTLPRNIGGVLKKMKSDNLIILGTLSD